MHGALLTKERRDTGMTHVRVLTNTLSAKCCLLGHCYMYAESSPSTNPRPIIISRTQPWEHRVR